jgi:hypothetical protein
MYSALTERLLLAPGRDMIFECKLLFLRSEASRLCATRSITESSNSKLSRSVDQYVDVIFVR